MIDNLVITDIETPLRPTMSMPSDPIYTEPHFELIENENDIPHWCITQSFENEDDTEVRRISIEEMSKLISALEASPADVILEVCGTDESRNRQTFYIQKTLALMENLKAELFMRLEIYRLSKSAERASQEGTLEYNETLGRFWDIFQELAKR